MIMKNFFLIALDANKKEHNFCRDQTARIDFIKRSFLLQLQLYVTMHQPHQQFKIQSICSGLL